MMSESAGPVVGVVLAGGLARRMGGGDKPLVRLSGRSLLDHVLDRLAPQCAAIVLNANGDPDRFASFGLPVVPDSVDEFPGPLAGILAGLDYAAEHVPAAKGLVSIAGDCPFLPRDLVSKLEEARASKAADIAVAASGGRQHPVIGLWPVALRSGLRRALVQEGVRKVGLFLSRHEVTEVQWRTEPVDPFFNVNDGAGLAEAERLVALLSD